MPNKLFPEWNKNEKYTKINSTLKLKLNWYIAIERVKKKYIKSRNWNKINKMDKSKERWRRQQGKKGQQ